ncbi:unnamed protein product [Strongylus vulgaris]|uniref:Helicase ATP-binding domain-containing protein n=1 Tax=Strongylus vulgaris TaxID=40348 RepID=A0A3P7IM48_STRVU|nr:unnamed protein product [Strongylus vulgaris]
MEEFSFPFPPYNIQLDLMREIKQCIDNEQVGIFESPTGTGKSLSVLCATMTWLEEFERKTEEDLLRDAGLKENVEEEGLFGFVGSYLSKYTKCNSGKELIIGQRPSSRSGPLPIQEELGNIVSKSFS